MTKNLFKSLMLIFIVLMNNLQLSSQISEFNLSDFKLPDIKRQGINFAFNLSGGSYEHENRIDTFDVIKNKQLDINNSLYGNYFLLINTRKYQGSHSFSISNSIFISDYKSNFSERKSKNFNYRTNLYSINRFYSEKEYFVSVGVIGDIDAAISKYENYYDSTIYENEDYKVENESTSNRLSIPIGIGKGRIEPVEDARHAFYILQELQKANRLKHNPSQNEILEFARRISEIKNERILDYRLKKIYELSQLDSVLNEMDLLESSDMVYFSTLNDMWDYGGWPQRSSGFRVELKYSPEYEFNVAKSVYFFPNDYENETNYNSLNSNFKMDINWNKPIRQRLQSDLFVGITYFIMPDNGNKKNGLESSINYAFGIYPNTRTSFNFGVNLWGSKSWRVESEYQTDLWQYNIRPSFSINYYFSPKLQLDLGFSSRYYYEFLDFDLSDSENNGWNNYLDLRLLYSIF